MMKVAMALVLCASALTPAHAGWQYTQWRMSPDDVVSASRGAASKIPLNRMQSVQDQDLLVQGAYRTLGINFEVRFFFSPLSGKLSMVGLKPPEPRLCRMLATELAGQYGTPEERTQNLGAGRVTMTHRWSQPSKNLRIVHVTNFQNGEPGECVIFYEPNERANTGL
jgi:hypothetical protein